MICGCEGSEVPDPICRSSDSFSFGVPSRRRPARPGNENIYYVVVVGDVVFVDVVVGVGDVVGDVDVVVVVVGVGDVVGDVDVVVGDAVFVDVVVGVGDVVGDVDVVVGDVVIVVVVDDNDVSFIWGINFDNIWGRDKK